MVTKTSAKQIKEEIPVNSKRETRTRERRRKQPPGTGRYNINVVGKDEENYFYYACLQDEVDEFKASDYEVCDPEAEGLSLLGRKNASLGNSLEMVSKSDKGNHVLMRKPMEWYLEDQKVEKERIDREEAAIYNPGEGLTKEDETSIKRK